MAGGIHIYTHRVHIDKAYKSVHDDHELPLIGLSLHLGYVVGIQGTVCDTVVIDEYTIVQLSRMDFHNGLVPREKWLWGRFKEIDGPEILRENTKKKDSLRLTSLQPKTR